MTTGIVRDLWSDIVQLVPLDALRDLSKASPLFDEVICKAGIRVFYDGLGARRTCPEGRDVVIQFVSGRKYLVDTNRVIMRQITVHNKFYDFDGHLDYDSDSLIGMLIRSNSIHVFNNFMNYDYYRIAQISKRIDEDVTYIDFDANVAVSIRSGYRSYAFEFFKILFKDGLWKH